MWFSKNRCQQKYLVCRLTTLLVHCMLKKVLLTLLLRNWRLPPTLVSNSIVLHVCKVFRGVKHVESVPVGVFSRMMVLVLHVLSVVIILLVIWPMTCMMTSLVVYLALTQYRKSLVK